MLDINRILQDNHLMQVFTGLDQTQCGQLFPLFVQAYKAHYSDLQQLDMRSKSASTTTLAGEYNQLFFILFCFRWRPELTLLSNLFGLDRSQASWWVHQLKPVLLKVYRPGWDRDRAKPPAGQLQSLAELIALFPTAQQAVILEAGPVEPALMPSATGLNQPSRPVQNRFSRFIQKVLRRHGSLVLPAAGVAAAIVIAGLPVVFFLQSQAQLTPAGSQAPQSVQVSPLPTGQSARQPVPSVPSVATPAPELSAQPAQTPAPSEPPVSAPMETRPYEDASVAADSSGLSRYNHLYYLEAEPYRIVSVGFFVRESYRREEFLDYEAAQAFTDMKAAAAQQGVKLIPISGFREIARQQKLFEEQVEKHGSEETAARLSAPPGYSEHHTGYAIDIGDADRPDADIKYAFEDTQAYRWLSANAQAFGFEESFPKNNQQGVSFEPWHWRYVGSPRAESTFIVSKTMFP